MPANTATPKRLTPEKAMVSVFFSRDNPKKMKKKTQLGIMNISKPFQKDWTSMPYQMPIEGVN